jgi:GT2 family glycosyltransferase
MELKSNKTVSIIIVTCAIDDYLKSCLDSIKKQSYSALEIVVIDNSLNKNFSQNIIACYPEIKLYPQKKNISYCQALNLGINVSKGDFVLCLNDDVILDNRFIEEALKGFFIDNRVGMVSGKILRSDGQTLDSTGLFLTCYRTTRERGYGLKDKGQFEEGGSIFGVSGAAAFYRRGMLEEIKEAEDYFDSDFGFFYEDLDIAWRANRAGWKGYYIPSAIGYHIRGGSVRKKSGINKPFARRFLSDNLHLDLIKNRYLAIIKNESCLVFLLHLPCILLYDLVMWSYYLVFRPRLIKKFFVNIRYLKSALEKRRFSRR